MALDVTIQYREEGAGTPVVMLHGYSDSWYSYATVLEHLGGRVRGFALTQRGHGDPADRAEPLTRARTLSSDDTVCQRPGSRSCI